MASVIYLQQCSSWKGSFMSDEAKHTISNQFSGVVLKNQRDGIKRVDAQRMRAWIVCHSRLFLIGHVHDGRGSSTPTQGNNRKSFYNRDNEGILHNRKYHLVCSKYGLFTVLSVIKLRGISLNSQGERRDISLTTSMGLLCMSCSFNLPSQFYA